MPTGRTPLLFPHDDRARYDRHQLAFGRAVTLLLMVAPLFISASYLLADRPRGLAVALPFAAVGAAGFALLARGRARRAFLLLVYGTWISAFHVLVATDGVRSSAVSALPLVILISGWLVGTRHTIALTAITLPLLFGLAAAEALGAFTAVRLATTPLHTALEQSVIALTAGTLGYFAARSLQGRFHRLEESQRSLQEKVDELSVREREIEGLRRRFEALFRHGPTPTVFGVPGEGTILDCNEAFAVLVGRPREELVGRNSAGIGYWKDLAERERAYEVLRRDGRLEGFETVFLRPDGEERHCLLQWQLIELDGQTLQIAEIADITALRRAQAAQRESEGRFAAAFFASPNAVLFTRARDHVIVEVNPSFERLTGYAREEIVGHTALELGLWRDATVRDRIIGRVLMGEKVVEEPFQALVRGARVLDCRYSGTLVEIEGEMHVLSIARDVSAETRALAALAARERELDAAIRQLRVQVSLHELTESVARVGHWFTDTVHDRVEWSRSLYEISGVAERGPMTVAESRGLVRLEEREDFEEARRRRDGKPGIFHFRRPDGEARWVRASILQAPGDAAGFFGVVQDISDEYRAKLALEKLNAELEQRVAERTAELLAANSELDAFSYSVAHDLNAPLRAINGFAGILEEEAGAKLAPSERGHLARIREGTERMGELIRDLLQLSHVTRAELHRRRVDLSGLAREIAADLAAQQPGRAVDWRIEDGLVGHGDPGLLRVALRNLLENAWKYTRDRPRPVIEFGCRRPEGQEPEYFVRDNGAGFDMAQARRIFTPFQRLHAEGEFEGSGIGLATVQRVLFRHGGRARADSAPGEGATIYFTLPAPPGA